MQVSGALLTAEQVASPEANFGYRCCVSQHIFNPFKTTHQKIIQVVRDVGAADFGQKLLTKYVVGGSQKLQQTLCFHCN